MEEGLKIIFGLGVAAILALAALFFLGAFEMSWFDDFFARFG